MSVFQTDAWQKSWWETWGGTPGFEPVTGSAGGANGLYLAHYRFKGFPIHALECTGTSHRCIATPRTEYNTLLGDTPGPDAYDRLLELLCSRKWTETVLSDFRVNSTEYQLLQKLCRDKSWPWRLLAEDTAYSVKTIGPFDADPAYQGGNTRERP